MSLFFRRSACVARSTVSRQAITYILSSELSCLASSISLETSSAPPTYLVRGFHSFSSVSRSPAIVGHVRRDIHFSTLPLSFRATEVSQAGVAVQEIYEERKRGDEGLEIAKLGISQAIVSALAKKNITKLFPIQKAVLEPAMQGRDMIGRAKTGTGKTLAFGIPVMDKIIRYNAKHGRGRNPLALILAPTRELAKQVDKELMESSQLETLCAYGGVPIQGQMRTLSYGVDVLVGTPGRVIDLLKRGALNVSEVQFVILDEADQMLAIGFAEDVEVILGRLPRKRQSMLFSATMPAWIKMVSQKYLKNPVTVDLVGESDQKIAEGISLYSIPSENYGKPSILGPLIKEHAKGGKCIVFTQTKRDADMLTYAMSNKSYSCEALHGDISQGQREITLAGFRDGRFNILIATDVAARGLDIPNVDLVIHYELPNNTEMFVHRSGRTGRAGKKGSAILIYTQEQTRTLRIIEEEIGCKFTELPSISVSAKDAITRLDYGGGRGGFGRGGFGRGGFGSSSGRSGGFGGSSGGGFGSSSGRSGGFGGSSGGGFGSSSGRSGGFGGSSGGGFGSSSGRSGGFGSSGGSGFGRSGGFGGSSSGFGKSGGSGGSGGGWSGGFGSSGSRQFGTTGNSAPAVGSFGGSAGAPGKDTTCNLNNNDNSWP